MKQPKITLPEDIFIRLREEAARLEMDPDLLVAGLVKNFLDRQDRQDRQNRSNRPTGLVSPASGSASDTSPDASLDTPDAKQLASDMRKLASESKQFAATAKTANAERRSSIRKKLSMTAMLYFKTDAGRSAVYRAGGLKDIGPGGLLVECDRNLAHEPAIRRGGQVVLIFQPHNDQPPLHLQCEIRRVDESDEKTLLGWLSGTWKTVWTRKWPPCWPISPANSPEPAQ